jgi:predicted  nucleic acid-binding Zn-ribbon protein
MFGTDPVLRDLNSRITELTREVAALRGERQAARDDLAQLQDARELREEIETLISYLKNDIISEVFKRLPVVEVNKTLEFSTDGGNGAASEG